MFKRILSLVLALGTATGAVVAVQFSPIKIGQDTTPQTVIVKPKEPTLVCPGPVFVNGGLSGVTIGSFTQAGTADVFGNDGGSAIRQTTNEEVVLRGSDNGSKNFNAIQLQAAAGKQAFGLSAANCVPGSNSGWLIAGDNTVGREALLVLSNPSAVDATVSLQLFGTSGAIQGAGLSGISAPAGKVTVLPLSSFAPKTETFAVQVSVRGAELGIWLQQKTVRGLTPGGLDLVGLSAEPSQTVLIPGLFLRGTSKLSALAAADKDFADTKPILRITAPGNKPANFTAQIQGADGSSFGNVLQGNVPAGSTRDFALEDLADGNYAIQVTSDAPVLAATRFSRMSGTTPDFAWAQSVTPRKLDAGFTTASGATTKLSIVNGYNKDAKVTVNGQQFTVAANSNLVYPVASGTSFSVSSNRAVAVSQVVDVRGGVTVVPVLDYRNIGGKLKITVR